MTYSKWIVVAALAAPTAAAPVYAQGMNQDTQSQHQQHQQQQTVQMKDLPSAVQTTVKRESEGKQVQSIKKEEKDGKTVYNVQLEKDGKSQGIQVSEAGKVLKREGGKQSSGSMSEKPSSTSGQTPSGTGSY